MSEHHDVIVVGAGPAGVACAATVAESGKRRVALLDDAPLAGGQIWRHRGSPARAARRWLGRLPNVTHVRQARVVAVPAERALLVDAPGGPRVMTWSSLVLATGARELFLPFRGWTLPNVVGAGGMQALVKQGLPVRGKTVVVAGSGPLLLAVAELLRREGARVPIVLEQTTAAKLRRFAFGLSPSKLLQAALLRARLLGTRYATSAWVTAASPRDAGLNLECQVGSKSETLDCDYLACGFGLVPNNELAQLLGCAVDADGFARVDGALRTSVAGVWAVGELTGIGGVEKSLAEGVWAGRAVRAADMATEVATPKNVPKDVLRARAFARRLAAAFALRDEVLRLASADTIVCRCEDVRLGAVARSLGGRDAKLQTRCGMGSCQGRVCGPILQKLLGAEPPQVRPPVFATAIGTLAALAEGSSAKSSPG